MTRSIPAAAVGLAALALAPAAAQAQAGSRTFAQTFPRASALCARAQAGSLPPKLAGQTSQVQSACTTLQGSFTSAQTTVLAAQMTFANGVAAARAKTQAACVKPRVQPTCRLTRIQDNATIKSLRAQHRADVRTYYISVEAARRTFWTSIRALRGGPSVKPDTPVKVQSS
jgi:hypothetical protein